MVQSTFRERLVHFIRQNALPPDKFSHQARVYELARSLAEGRGFDDDILFAAVWLHDLGVFIGHRPEDPAQLPGWDHVKYVLERAPDLLINLGFPPEKVQAVLKVIKTHMPQGEPTTFEGTLMRDADILEQLGAVGILRTVSKVGRDTRFITFKDALRVLDQNLHELPGKLQLEFSRRLAAPRVDALRSFLAAAERERSGIDW